MTDQSQQAMKQMFETDTLGTGAKPASTDGHFMSLQEASNQTGLSMGTLRRYVKARKLKSRRLGRSFNSKLEVWITSDMLADQPGQSEMLDADEEIDGLVDDADFDYSAEGDDQSDNSLSDTMSWMQKKLDEKDDILREKEAKIEQLLHELTSASYRNGYLEAQKSELESKVLLLEDKSTVELSKPIMDNTESEKKNGWTGFARWFLGKSN